MNILNKYNKLIVIAFISFIILIIIFILYRTLIFQVINVQPTNNYKASSGSFEVTITFNKDINNIDTSKQISYNNKISIISKTEKNKLILYVSNILQGNKYNIKITNITSLDGEIIPVYNYNFISAYIPFSNLSDKERQQQINNTDKNMISYPIEKILPKFSDHYVIQYQVYDKPLNNGKYISLKITLLLEAQLYNDRLLASKYKSEALDFIKSNGFNPNDYIIEWAPEYAANL